MERNYIVELVVADNKEEDIVWSTHIAAVLEGVRENVLGICYYGFTEMLNNVIDHSDSESVVLKVIIDVSGDITIIIADFGVGIFEKVKRAFDLEDCHQAILELSKGGLTTDPERHSGQGIFFTSRAFDRFAIASKDLVFGHEAYPEKDWLRDDDQPWTGTFVCMSISLNSDRVLKNVFDEYSSVDEGFTRTHILVKLAREGSTALISRSQAKRILARCDRFQTIELDFEGLDFIGQAFADEIFRVFTRQYPDVKLEVINASPSVQEMISRVRVAATPGYESALKPLGIPALEAMGREIDDGLREWRHKGMNGSPEERELFLGEVFHGARATMRLGLMAATAASPEKSRRQLLEAAVPKMLEFAHQQAIDSGFNEEQTELYIATQKRAYESLEDEP